MVRQPREHRLDRARMREDLYQMSRKRAREQIILTPISRYNLYLGSSVDVIFMLACYRLQVNQKMRNGRVDGRHSQMTDFCSAIKSRGRTYEPSVVTRCGNDGRLGTSLQRSANVVRFLENLTLPSNKLRRRDAQARVHLPGNIEGSCAL
jgi:hypothetical protein